MRFKRNGTIVPAKLDPKDNEIRWSSFGGVVFVIALFLAAQVIGGLILALYFGLTGASESEITRLYGDSVYVQFGYVLLTEIIVIIGLYLFLKYYKSTFRTIGLKRPRLKDVGYGLLAVVPYYAVFILVTIASGALFPGLDTNQKQEIGFDNVQGLWPLAATFLVLVLLQPLIEEIMVRGFLYSSLKKAFPIVLAALITSLLFGAAHLAGGGSGGPLYIAAIDTFVLSLFLIYLRERTGSLWASVTLHSIKNGIAFLALFIFKVG